MREFDLLFPIFPPCICPLERGGVSFFLISLFKNRVYECSSIMDEVKKKVKLTRKWILSKRIRNTELQHNKTLTNLTVAVSWFPEQSQSTQQSKAAGTVSAPGHQGISMRSEQLQTHPLILYTQFCSAASPQKSHCLFFSFIFSLFI